MPVLSRFLGIVIAMYWNDHAPPHFHAKYGEYEVKVFILDGVVEGNFPRRALKYVLEWYEMHRQELLTDWGNVRKERSSESDRAVGIIDVDSRC